MPPRSIYFDYNATTSLDPAVREVMLPFLGEVYGNPSSIHHVGRRARALLDSARERTAAVFQCKPSEIVFTSGGTESNNLAIFGTARLLSSRGKHLITSAVEHHAVLSAMQCLARREGFELTVLPVDTDGRVSPDTVAKAIRPDTILVSVMAANNEIGTINPVSVIGEICRSRGVVFHTDAVQWFGKQSFDSIHQFHADLVSFCAHKLHGPKGAGALFIRSPLHPEPLLVGGAHENERRAGTENLPAIVGLVEATERFVPSPTFDPTHLWRLTVCLDEAICRIPGVILVSPETGRLPNTVSFVAEKSDSITLLAALDVEGICASSGSACAAGSLEPSHVILALGLEPRLANALVRFSLGRENTQAEVDRVIDLLPAVIRRAQLGQ